MGMPLLNFRNTRKNMAPAYVQAVHATLMASHRFFRGFQRTPHDHIHHEAERALAFLRNVLSRAMIKVLSRAIFLHNSTES